MKMNEMGDNKFIKVIHYIIWLKIKARIYVLDTFLHQRKTEKLNECRQNGVKRGKWEKTEKPERTNWKIIANEKGIQFFGYIYLVFSVFIEIAATSHSRNRSHSHSHTIEYHWNQLKQLWERTEEQISKESKTLINSETKVDFSRFSFIFSAHLSFCAKHISKCICGKTVSSYSLRCHDKCGFSERGSFVSYYDQPPGP